MRPIRSHAIAATCCALQCLAAQGEPPATTTSPAREQRAARRAALREPKVQRAIADGLQWLRAHQDGDGHWDCRGFGKHDGGVTDGGSESGHDCGATGLAVLALLAEADPQHDDAITRGVDWLQRQMNADGRIDAELTDGVYGHAIATLALADATAMLGTDRWLTTLRRAVASLLAWRNPGAAWRYQPRDNDNDTSVTYWCLAALLAAGAVDVEVPPAAIGETLAWIESATDAGGRTGYTRAGEPSSRHTPDHIARFPPELGEAMTAAALHLRLSLTARPDSPQLQPGIALCLAKPPGNDPKARDFYYWYHASSAMAQLPKETATKWFRALDATLLRLQRDRGPCAGSWNPDDVFGEDGGRIVATALCVQSLQARYRDGEPLADVALRTLPCLQGIQRKLAAGDRGGAISDLDKIDPGPLSPPDRRGVAAVRLLVTADQQGLAASIARLRAATPPDWVELQTLLERAAERYRGSAFGTEAEQQLRDLQQDAKVRPHLEAWRKLQTLRERFKKKKPSNLRLLTEPLQKLVADHPGTRAADEASRWLHDLGVHDR